ncbi:MAG: type II toxin-antitoxin system VapC family toxin [Acidobacteria bacterium]|nr:type II toxin-antitoxin system VapC family toxin [Acidobacteriota bacterium]
MIALDTNVLVRILIEDNPKQVAAAAEAVEGAVERGEKILIGDIVLAELEWVLDSAYGVPRERIHGAMLALLEDERFVFEDRRRVVSALDRYRFGRGDLSDFLLGFSARDHGASAVLTFDKALRKEVPFLLL